MDDTVVPLHELGAQAYLSHDAKTRLQRLAQAAYAQGLAACEASDFKTALTSLSDYQKLKRLLKAYAAADPFDDSQLRFETACRSGEIWKLGIDDWTGFTENQVTACMESWRHDRPLGEVWESEEQIED